MGAKVRPENFKGKKGRSGRYTAFNERTKHQVIKDSWIMTGQNLNPDRALPIVLKDMGKDDAKTQPTVIINVDGVLTKKYEPASESTDNSGGQSPIQGN